MSEDGVEESEVVKPEEKPPAKAGAPHMALRIVLGTAGLLLVVGFFLPWVQIDREMRSGLELVVESDPDVRDMVDDTQRWILLVIPVLGAALTAIGFLGVRGSGAAGTVVGFLLMAYGLVTVCCSSSNARGSGSGSSWARRSSPSAPGSSRCCGRATRAGARPRSSRSPTTRASSGLAREPASR